MPRETKSAKRDGKRDEPYAKNVDIPSEAEASEDDAETSPINVTSQESLKDFSDEHKQAVGKCWGIWFNLCEHGPIRQTTKEEIRKMRVAGNAKSAIRAQEANSRNFRIGKAVRELLKMAKEEGSVTALETCQKLLKDTTKEVKEMCAEWKEAFIPIEAARKKSNFSKDNLDVKSLFRG